MNIMRNLNGRVICLKNLYCLGLSALPGFCLSAMCKSLLSRMLSPEFHPMSSIVCLMQENKAFIDSRNKGKEKIRNECIFCVHKSDGGRVNVERQLN